MIDEYIVDYDEYAGLGSGSIGYLSGVCYANTFDIRDYIAQIDRGELPLAASRVFSLRDRIRYDFLMKLFGTRLNVAELRKKYGGAFFGLLWPDLLAFSLIGALAWHPPDDHPDAAGPVRLGGPDAGVLHGGQQLPRLLPGAAAP